MKPSTVEEHPETAVKAWKRRFLMELQTSRPMLISPHLLACRSNKKSSSITTYKDSVTHWAGAGKDIQCLAGMVQLYKDSVTHWAGAGKDIQCLAGMVQLYKDSVTHWAGAGKDIQCLAGMVQHIRTV